MRPKGTTRINYANLLNLIPETLKMCLDDESVQFTFLTVVFVDQSLFTVNIVKHATHNVI
jgi:hypothetical protein